MKHKRQDLKVGAAAVLLAIATAAKPATLGKTTCEKVVLTGEAAAGQEWKARIGEGWVFRVLPIGSGKPELSSTGYSGWDLVVDREQPAGFPDGLLLATPPYNSINEREVGTTFGMRAQDAIGWNPRSFRFLTRASDLAPAQQLFLAMNRNGHGGGIGSGTGSEATRIMEAARDSAAGRFQILDARLTPGIADAAPFAENWALRGSGTPHTLVPAKEGKSTRLGQFEWIRFSITLWLPSDWKAPAVLGATRTACSE